MTDYIDASQSRRYDALTHFKEPDVEDQRPESLDFTWLLAQNERTQPASAASKVESNGRPANLVNGTTFGGDEYFKTVRSSPAPSKLEYLGLQNLQFGQLVADVKPMNNYYELKKAEIPEVTPNQVPKNLKVKSFNRSFFTIGD